MLEILKQISNLHSNHEQIQDFIQRYDWRVRIVVRPTTTDTYYSLHSNYSDDRLDLRENLTEVSMD